MSDFCTITPSRGDRPQLLEFCKHQLSRMTLKPEKSYFIDHPPLDSRKDLVPRIQEGIELARKDGFDKVYIVEDDDLYPKDYFERMSLTGDMIGSSKTICYNLRFNSCQTFSHPDRSSLFHTAFRISALTKFRWPDDQYVFLDLRLWKFAKSSRIKSDLIDPIAVSIKHNIGLVGGKGHRMNYENKDPMREHLKILVDQEAYAFYQTLNL